MNMELEFESLYEMLWKEQVRINSSSEEQSKIPYSSFLYGVVIYKYQQCDDLMLKMVSKNITDIELIACILKDLKAEADELKKAHANDTINIAKYYSCCKNIELLENGDLATWIADNFLPCLRAVGAEILEAHIKGFCYVLYGYKDYCKRKKSVYNRDLDRLKSIYSRCFDKNSELHTYGLIEIDKKCELLAIDPPRLFDPRVNKTFYLSNIKKDLLELFLGISGLYEKLSVRVSNLDMYIFDGRNTEKILQEAFAFGKPFNKECIGSISVTKLYSEDMDNTFWVKSDHEDITFEELCSEEDQYADSVITQVVHMQYKNSDSGIIITHIDHEFIFYSKEDYEKRKNNVKIKGSNQPRLKSFKIDNARIPIDLQCEHAYGVQNEMTNDAKILVEKIPFLIYILKEYFTHTELIDEYFAKLLEP